MNQQHREIRAMLKCMAPKRAIAWIQSFELPQEEAQCIAECDVRGRSCVEQAFRMNVSVDGVKRRRRTAYKKMADGLRAEKRHTE
jgi:DNA-directed RNA polymerase specialized sigma24 family protein